MYLNVIELAESFGVEESVVENWIRSEGLPYVPDRGRLLFDRAQVVAWAAQRGRAAKAGFLAATESPLHEGRRLEPLLRAGGIWRDVTNAKLLGILEGVLAGLPGTTAAIRQLLAQRLRSAPGITWAPVGGGLALPHLRAPVALGPQSGILSALLLKEPLELQEPIPDQLPVTGLLFFLAPSPRSHLELLGQISAALSRGSLRAHILGGAADAEILSALRLFDESRRKELPK